jgi:hypothetical protein
MMATDEKREALETRILQGLRSCDEDTLLRIEQMLSPTQAHSSDEAAFFKRGLTRRQFLVGAAAGGAIVVSTNAATGLVAGALGAKVGETRAEVANQVELIKLRGLVALYENLEQVGIDAIASAGLAALRISLDGLQLGVSGLQSAVTLVDDAVSTFERAFPTIRRGLSLAERLVTSVEERVTDLQELMGEVQDVVSPLTDALGSFFSSLVARIPGVGQKILDTLDRISELVGSLPQAIDQMNTSLLEPLREDWFTDDEDQGLKGTLLNPLQDSLLGPLEQFLGDLSEATGEWEEQLINPVEKALTQREVIRKQISEYKEREALT